jgi:hypothetical protein
MTLRPFLLSVAALCNAADLYVSTSGNDQTGTGSESSPFQTPHRAVEAIASSGQCPSEGYVVHILAGLYTFASTLEINASSSCPTSSVVFVGDGAGKTVLSGGIPIPSWTSSGTVPGVYSALVPNQGSFVRQLFDSTGGVTSRRQLARTPIMTSETEGQWGLAFPSSDSVARALASKIVPSETELVIWHNWVSSQNKICVFNNTNSSIKPCTTAGDPFFNAGGNRWALQNLPDDEILAPGQFYIHSGQIVYKALPGEDPTNPSSVQFIAENLPVIISLNGASNYNFVNLTVSHSAAMLESCFGDGCASQSNSDAGYAGIIINACSSITFDSVELTLMGSYAIWFNSGTSNSGITKSWIHNLGSGGVRIGNGTDTFNPNAAPAMFITVADCIIEDGGHVVPAGTGVLGQEASHMLITHNHINNFAYTGVAIGWTWGYASDSDANNEVSFNQINNIFRGELSDGACVYNLGRSPGTLIDHNICFDVNSYNYGGWGYYTDEGSSNVTISNNLVYDTKSAGMHQHYGTDNLFVNNIFAFGSSLACPGEDPGVCDMSALRSSQHGGGCSNSGSGEGCNSSFTFERNIVFLGAANITASPWVVNNTHVVKTTNNNGILNGVTNMTWNSNLYWHANLPSPSTSLVFSAAPGMSFPSWQALGKDAGSIIADPLFADASQYNFTLLPNSPVLALGFEPIDFSTVGPRRTPFKVNL